MKNSFVYFMLVVVLVFAAYMPVLQGNYLYHDDYFLMKVGGLAQCSDHPQYSSYLSDYVRPIGIYIKCLYSVFFDEPYGANVARTITVGVISVIGVYFFAALASLGTPHLAASGFAVGIVVLPPFNTAAAMIANATHVYALLAALIAASVGVKSAKLFNIGTNWGRARILVITSLQLVAAFFVFISTLIYQPGSLGYVLPVMFFALAVRTESLREFYGLIIVSCFPLAVGTLAHLVSASLVGSKRAAVTDNITEKIDWLMADVMPGTLSFWSVTPSRIIMFMWFLLFLLTSIIYLGKDLAGRKDLLMRLSRYAVITLLAFVSYAPNIMASESVFFYRTLISFQPALFLLPIALAIFSFPCDRLQSHGVAGRAANILLIALALGFAMIGTFRAHELVALRYVQPQTVELGWLRERLRSVTLHDGTSIHIVRPRNAISGFGIRDEFGPMTTFFAQDTPFITVAALRQIMSSEKRDIRVIHGFRKSDGLAAELVVNGKRLFITSGLDARSYDFPIDWPPARNLPVPQGSVVIDMNEIGLKDLAGRP